MATPNEDVCQMCGPECVKCCPFYIYTDYDRPCYGAECFFPRAASKCAGDNLCAKLCVPFVGFFECFFYNPTSWAIHGCPSCEEIK